MPTLAIMMPEIPPAQAVRLNAGNVGREFRDRYGEALGRRLPDEMPSRSANQPLPRQEVGVG